MALPQRDKYIEELKRIEGLMARGSSLKTLRSGLIV
jgi:hypothetical protein